MTVHAFLAVNEGNYTKESACRSDQLEKFSKGIPKLADF